jgi:FkbM family methyltransferase
MKAIIILFKFFKITKLIKFILNKVDFEIVNSRTMTFDKSLKKIIDIYNIEVILDVGSNIGQFASKILKSNYQKKLVLIEPVKKNFHKLNEEIKQNKLYKKENVEFYNIALGTKNSYQTMFKSSRGGDMDSLLTVNNDAIDLVKNSQIIGEETVEVQDINFFLKNMKFKENIFIKFDTEGLDFKLVKHINQDYLKKVTAIMIEVGEVKFFNNQEGNPKEIDEFFERNDFILYNIDPFFSNPATGQLLVRDNVYLNKKIIPKNLDYNFNEKIGNSKIYT